MAKLAKKKIQLKKKAAAVMTEETPVVTPSVSEEPVTVSKSVTRRLKIQKGNKKAPVTAETIKADLDAVETAVTPTKSKKLVKLSKTAKPATTTETTPAPAAKRRISKEKLMSAAKAAGTFSLATNRVVEQLQALVARATVQKFSGRRERPELILSAMEKMALEQACALFAFKANTQNSD